MVPIIRAGILGGAQQHRSAQRAERPAARRGAASHRPAGAASARRRGRSGKTSAEVDEQRRQQQRGNLIGPVEHPVDAVEAAREREREHAEERHREPEEVQCRLVGRTPRPHGGTDQQREDADRRQHVVEACRHRGDRRQRDLRHPPIAEGQQGVGVPRAAARGLLQCVHGVARFDGLAVHGQQHVAGAHAGAGGRRRRIDLGGDDPGRALHPQHAVFDVVAVAR